MLTSVSEEDGDITAAIADSEELAIFKTPIVMDMLDYKWDVFAQSSHRLGCLIHIIYVVCLIMYINF